MNHLFYILLTLTFIVCVLALKRLNYLVSAIEMTLGINWQWTSGPNFKANSLVKDSLSLPVHIKSSVLKFLPRKIYSYSVGRNLAAFMRPEHLKTLTL